METETIRLEPVTFLNETRRAVRVMHGERKAWIPESQIIEHGPCGQSQAYIVIPKWLAIEKELV